jgi:hypothetical protein
MSADGRGAVEIRHVILALILLVITVGGLARVDFRCRAGEVATTNHRPICANDRVLSMRRAE